MSQLVVPARFNGPPGSGNGGWTAGSLAAALDPQACVTVRLHRPPPLDTALEVVPTPQTDGGTGASARRSDGTVVLDALVTRPQDHPGLAPVPRVADEQADAAAPRYRGRRNHPFPTCFTCGPDRPPGDGLHLTPGVLEDRPGDTACTWVPDEADPDVPTVWAALDCPGGWSVDLVGRPMVLGTITAAIHRLPRRGERCVVMGRALDVHGRKASTATTLWSGDEVLARATAVWVAVDPKAFSALRGSSA